MKFLIDNSLSPAIAEGLKQAGHDAVHLREYGMQGAPDDAVIERARSEDRSIVTYDLDFPRLLTLRRETKPSLIIFRRTRDPYQQLATLLGNLGPLETGLGQGCVVVFEPDRIRVRDLPLGRGR